nr:uncharacterized protein LOC101065220 [Takifugu rubripes]
MSAVKGAALHIKQNTLSMLGKERGKSQKHHQKQEEALNILSSQIPPMQFPHFERKRQTATSVSREQGMDSIHVSKRQRKLLKTSPPINHTNINFSLLFFP